MCDLAGVCLVVGGVVCVGGVWGGGGGGWAWGGV